MVESVIIRVESGIFMVESVIIRVESVIIMEESVIVWWNLSFIGLNQ